MAAYERAIELTTNPVERDFLRSAAGRPLSEQSFWKPAERSNQRAAEPEGGYPEKAVPRAGHSCKHQVPAGGDLVGMIRLVVVDWLVANRTSAFRGLPEASTRRIRAGDVGSLTEECDRRQEDTSAIRCAWREPVDRTWVPSPSTSLTWPVRAVSLRVFIEREGEG